MEMDEKLHWLESRISSSLKPRNDDLKNLFTNDENRLVFHEFLNNEDVRKLFVYVRPPRQLIASLSPPHEMQSKSVFFLKNNAGVKLTKENMGEEVRYEDCAENPLEQLDIILREVYLPLLCTDVTHAVNYGVNPDKLMDTLHRLMAAVETADAHKKGEVVLPYPSIEVLAEAAVNVNRRGAVLHVLETTVISWIKQIKAVLKHDPISDLAQKAGPLPGPLDEVELWTRRLERLHSINTQLDSPVAVDILRNLDDANSTYAHSFQHVRKDIARAIQDTEENLKFLSTMRSWFEQLHYCLEPQTMLKLFPPLINTLLLVWTHSKYYHQRDKFNNLLRLISNEVVHRAEAMVGEDVLHEPLKSYSKLKEALRVCAAFRGTYLDYRDKADVINEKNKQEHAEKLTQRPEGRHTLISVKMYGPNAYVPRYGLSKPLDEEEERREEELWRDSPWPPRNATAFNTLNSFMERCNDVLELVQTTSHFQLLADAAAVGGAGSQSLDALVREIHVKYSEAMEEFFAHVKNVLAIDGTQAFERAFFTFRMVVKDLERRLADVLRQSFKQCPTIGSQLRLLEVFEGISGRELVQAYLKDKDQQLVDAFREELLQVKEMFKSLVRNPPLHLNMPPIVCKLLWVYALKQRIQLPMAKMKKVSPHSLDGDQGWQLRDAYSGALQEFESYEAKIISEWQNQVTAELTDRLKEPLLITENFEEMEDLRPQTVQVNLDPKLILLLREIHYLAQEPFCLKLPAPARELLRNTNSRELRVTATRLETIVSKYNTVMRTMSGQEQPLFERTLGKIDLLFQEGLNQYTWRTEESADFIETATALVCVELHQNLDIVQTNCLEIIQITQSWSQGTLDIFTDREPLTSYTMEELVSRQRILDEEFENCVIPAGSRVHALLDSSFQAVQISEASPAWQNYIDYIDVIVLDGLKQACLTSLKAMLNQIVKSNLGEPEDDTIPILTIRLELIENFVAYRPPLDESTSAVSVQETVDVWLTTVLSRGSLVEMLAGKRSYQEYISMDEDIGEMVEHIKRLVEENSEESKKLFDLFRDYGFLWQQDVNETFKDFLEGKISPNPLRDSSKMEPSGASKIRTLASARSNSRASSARSKSSIESSGLMGTAERSFLTPKHAQEEEVDMPSLDEFDSEIDIYRKARDDIDEIADYHQVGWLRVDARPVKQVLGTYASKWMWTFTKYLSDQVGGMLESLDQFLKRIEPEIENITGEERDTTSFMKMMRLFNEVSAQQQEMDGKFAAMHRTVRLVKKYRQKLPDTTQKLFDAAPGRWNNLKTKVSLAKQRLGPRIQEESERITKDLATFGERVLVLQEELETSDIYSRECSLGDAWTTIDNFVRRLEVLENEAQDLIELQDLLETSVVNFSILPQCRHDLDNLKLVWETVRLIEEEQGEWKRQRWQKMNTKLLKEDTERQLEVVRSLPDDVYTWDVYMGLHETITVIQACLPLIDDLSNPAMRTRHWKQLVRVTGGAVTIDNDTLKRMTLGELLSLGLQTHVDDVRAIVQRAVKDLSIEQALKTYEEVWLSKIFELRQHVRSLMVAPSRQTEEKGDTTGDAQSEDQSETASVQQPPTQTSRSQIRTTSRVSNQSSLGRTRRTSASSLPQSLLNLADDDSPLFLLTNTDPIFYELEAHQVSLQAMQSSSAAGSFLDEVMKWQRRLQVIEEVMTAWLDVQDKWVELEEVYCSQEVRTALSHDSNLFAMVNRDFRLLMRATEKNPNVLQSCQRKNILSILERMNSTLEQCQRKLLDHLERRRQRFPRFYFLSMEDVLHIICNGYDLKQVTVYINKLFENIGGLVYNRVEDNEKCLFEITAVHSRLGEKLWFQKPLQCEGPIEGWLPAFVDTVKSALQQQLASAMGVGQLPQPPTRTRQIHSAGARRVQVVDKKGSDGRAPSREKPQSRSGSRLGSRQSQRRPDSSTGGATTTATTAPADNKEPEGPESWTLSHVAEIVYLSTQIQLTSQTRTTLEDAAGGNREAVQSAIDKTNETLQATVVMLKGLEDRTETKARREKEKSESEATKSVREKDLMSESASQVGTLRSKDPTTSIRGSALDLTLEKPHTPIVEEGSVRQEQDNTSTVEPSTAEPVDTMNISALPVVTHKAQEEPPPPEEEATDPSELKLVLFPSQIHKIASLIALICHQRDLLQRLQELRLASNAAVGDHFEWKSQLQYSFTEEEKSVQIQCLDNTFEYGYEYLGSAPREVVTPATERTTFSLTQAIGKQYGGLCLQETMSHDASVVKELGRCLGRPLYTFSCTNHVDHLMLRDIFKGYASTGSWICFNNLANLSPEVASVLSQLLVAVSDAVRVGKTSLQLNSEEVPLSSSCACFGVISTAIKVTAHDPEKLLTFNSAASSLPQSLLNQFRMVGVVAPDFKLVLEVLLMSQGFLNASDLAKKTVMLSDICKKLLGTNTTLTDRVTHLSYNSMEVASGWSRQTLNAVATEAGAILEQLLVKRLQQIEDDEQETLRLPGIGEEDEENDEETEEIENEDKPEQKTEQDDVSLSKEEVTQEENEAIVTALRNTFMPRLLDRDASVFAQLLRDLWPDVSVALTFGGKEVVSVPEVGSEAEKSQTLLSLTRGESKMSRTKTKSQADYFAPKSFRESLHLNTPVVALHRSSVLSDEYNLDLEGDNKGIGSMEDAIALATSDLGLMPGVAFQSRVSQLAQLSVAHKTIIVAGPPACGKSECIKTFAISERERGKTVNVQSVFTKSVESEELLGCWNQATREWKGGLLPALLRKFCLQPDNMAANAKPVTNLLQLDGQLDASQFELMESVLCGGQGPVVLCNSERLVVSESLRFIWETDSLAHLSPALLANVGVLNMSNQDVGWRMMLAMWLERRPESDQDLLRTLCDQYMETVMEHLGEGTKQPAVGGATQGAGPLYKRAVWQSEENAVSTFTTLLEALVNPFPDMSDVEIERCFNYAAIWAFAGTLDVTSWDSFSQWWRQTFERHIDYPEDGTVFDYMVDLETHQFVKWSDVVPAYSGTPNDGIPADAFVNTVTTQQLLHLLGLLSDCGKSVMLVGENGCGKSAIISERIRSVCSGEVAEVLSLSLQANRFTNARLLYDRLDERLEWKHGRTYVPKGNKRLLCFVDDINLSQVDQHHNQTAVELVRQHIDDGGFYDIKTHAWRYVKNVTYVTAVNPRPTARVPPLNSRLLRHFAVFGCPYPNNTELQTVFTTLLNTHFLSQDSTSLTTAVAGSTAHHLGIADEKIQSELREEESQLRELLTHVAKVNLELQTKLRAMFLPTAQRCHYSFTLRDAGLIFRNLCLSLRPACSKERLLLLWEHECYWVYGHRMINEVDYDRFRQAFIRAVRKDFTVEEHIELLSRKEKPIFSSLVEQDSGLVVTGSALTNVAMDARDEDAKTDMYRPTYDATKLKALLEHGMEEYNKTQPRIKLALYRVVLEQVCRLARVISSPHQMAHCVLVAEGCPGRTSVMASLAAHLCGYVTYKISPSLIASSRRYTLESFKADIVQAYTNAGVKRDKVLFLLEEEELIHEDFLVFLADFIASGSSISHLFTYEEQTTIINSIRTEVTQAGLTYTRDVAWEFFLRTVKRNFRICLILSRSGATFQSRCREYPGFFQGVNVFWFPHWTKRLLIKHAAFQLKENKWLDRVARENVAHMLATMHIVMRQQDGQETGSYNHLTNTTYEKFVERFVSMSQERYVEVQTTHSDMSAVMTQVQREHRMANKLKRELEHEKVVLKERKEGTIKILSQIGQDHAITEQQVRIVKAQMERTQRLKKLLPDFQVAHERAVYKTVAIVADTKKIVENINHNALSELRAMPKAIIDVEDLMAAIIMILKGPQSDLTWARGAKRQMANLERFLFELISFDEHPLPEQTLVLVEPYLKKPSFDPESLQKKTENAACASLCRWVKGVCRYNRMMVSKVKPLHKKVEQTSQSIDSAEHKMSLLENKRKTLEVRLVDLAKGFEEATIDKNEQEEKTIKMDRMLVTAGRLRKVLRREKQRIQQIIDSLPYREAAIPGGVAMAAALATYLGPYHYNIRRVMLTVHWRNCLRERGIPLVIDSIDEVRGRVVDWSIDGLKTASGASGLEIDEIFSLEAGDEEEEEEEDEEINDEEGTITGEDQAEKKDILDLDRDEEAEEEEQDEDDEDDDDDGMEKAQREEMEKEQLKKESTVSGLEQILEVEGEKDFTEDESQNDSGMSSDASLPITTEQFNQYMHSLLKLLVGADRLGEWVRKDFGSRQLENAAIIQSSWQRPPMLIDPYGEGVSDLNMLNRAMNKRRLVCLDGDTSADSQVIMAIEKGVLNGQPVLVENCTETIDSLLYPVIHHRNSALEMDREEESRLIKYCSRKILCHPNFRLYMSTTLPKPQFTPAIASSTTIVNCVPSNETLLDDLLTRLFARVRPELYVERRTALSSIDGNVRGLTHIVEIFKEKIHTKMSQSEQLLDERDVDTVADLSRKTLEMSQRVRDTKSILQDLNSLRGELLPLARRAAMLYGVLQALASIQREYQFPLPYFLSLLDEAVGGELPPEYTGDNASEEDYSEDETDEKPEGANSQEDLQDQQQTEAADGSKEGKEGSDDREKDTNKEAEGFKEGEKEEEGSEKSDQEPQSVFELPEVALLPTDGLEYTSLATEQVQELVDKLTSLVFYRVQQRLFEEHRLLFAALLCLNIQEEGEYFEEEEMSLLLRGNPGLDMQLSLRDFNSSDEPPSWLPTEKWEDILAVSVLAGPMDSLCVHIARHSEDWKTWYHSAQPEADPLPISDQERQQERAAEDDGSDMTDPGPLTDFHRLLILRLLRPDRFPVAMATYTSKNLSLSLTSQSQTSLEKVFETVDAGQVGIMVLGPQSAATSNEHKASSLKMTISPTQVIQAAADSQGATTAVVSVGAGCEQAVLDAIDTAERNDSWVVIEHFHLASKHMMLELKHLFHRLARGPEKQRAKFRIWVTSEPCQSVPLDMLQSFYVLTWDSLEQMVQGQGQGHSQGQGQETDEPELQFSSGSLQNVLATAIVAAFNSVPMAIWQQLQDASTSTKTTIFGIGVIHGMLAARQMFGTRGLSQYYSLGGAQLQQAVQAVASLAAQGDVAVEDVSAIVLQGIYGNVLVSPWDQQYIATVAKHVLTTLSMSRGDSLTLGTVSIPVPPADVELQELGSWFAEATRGEIDTAEGLSLHPSVNRENNDAIGMEFMRQLEGLYECQRTDIGDIQASPSPVKQLNMLRLRAILDNVAEQLPLLLELGEVPHTLRELQYDFPYHRPSVVSLATAMSENMPESIGFVLLQECLWFNSLLCHIRQNIHDIYQCLLTGPDSFPWQLKEMVYSLIEEHVPAAWVHPNCQPSTHALNSWQTDMKKRFAQMQGWVKRRMVPLFKAGGASTLCPPESHGHLQSVWLGGLVNPQALFTALRQEKAVLANSLLDQVVLACEVAPSNEEADSEVAHEGGMVLTGLYLQGACWDGENNTLSMPTHDLNPMPSVYVWPALESDSKNYGEEKEQQAAPTASVSTKYECPVFINKARQVCPLSLSLESTEVGPEKWTLAGTAIILDPGCPEDSCKKSRSLVLAKGRQGDSEEQSTARTGSEISGYGEEEEEEEEEKEREESVQQEAEEEYGKSTERSEQSTQSQLSYRAMTPTSDPLPPGLQMTREAPMLGEDKRGGDKYSSRESLGKHSQRSQQSKVSKTSQRSKVTPRSQASQKSQVSQKSQASQKSKAASQQSSQKPESIKGRKTSDSRSQRSVEGAIRRDSARSKQSWSSEYSARQQKEDDTEQSQGQTSERSEGQTTDRSKGHSLDRSKGQSTDRSKGQTDTEATDTNRSTASNQESSSEYETEDGASQESTPRENGDTDSDNYGRRGR